MRIGFASIYSWRPHVEHLIYLSKILSQAGHTAHFLTCDSSVSTCYTRLLKGRSQLLECAMCIAGGVRSYPVTNVRSIRRTRRTKLSNNAVESLVSSSAYTLQRTETPEDTGAREILEMQRRLAEPVQTVVANARAWIREQRLEAVLCFNGRMDLTKAVIFAALEECIPFVTVERHFFGHGLHLTPLADCLSLKEIHRLSAHYRELPLHEVQARYAGRLIGLRMRRQNVLEWRLYNLAAARKPWPTSGPGPRVAIFPSSRNEFQGHPEWRTDFDDRLTSRFDEVIERLGAHPKSCVVRCHPNWAEPIGLRTGWRSAAYYAEWARKRGFFIYSSTDTADSFSLMEDADIILVNGSSAGMEAAVLGKVVINLGHSTFEQAGFATHIRASHELDRVADAGRLPKREIARRALRFFYTYAKRHSQYVRYVRGVAPERNLYFEGADPGRVTQMLHSGSLEPDDPAHAPDERSEEEVLDLVLARNWDELIRYKEGDDDLSPMRIQRRPGLRWIDGLRARLPKGDRRQ